MDKRDETMGQWDTIREAEGASWQAAEGLTFGDLDTLRDEGVLLAGRYKVLKRLGEGGMGSVWLAEDAKLDGRKVAIKMLPSILVGKKGAYKQVKAEAMVAMKLSHPNIATVRAFEEDDGGNPFLVMDYIDGEGLDYILAEKGALGEEETLRILGPVAAALDYAHSQGVVHRDVKPGNIIVRKDGTPFVLDFGIAREVQETMTRVTGKLSSGTLLYMSPEQLNGRSPKAAQDVYSFAAMAYECLTRNPPFSRGQIEWQIMNNPPDPLPESVSDGLRKGVMAGLAKEAEGRPESCARVLGKETVKTGENRFVNSEKHRADRENMMGGKRKGIGWGWVLALLLAAGMGWWWWQEDVSRRREETEIRRASDEIAWQVGPKRLETEEAVRQAEGERLGAEKAEDERQKAEEEDRKIRERVAVAAAAPKTAAAEAEPTVVEEIDIDEVVFPAADEAESADSAALHTDGLPDVVATVDGKIITKATVEKTMDILCKQMQTNIPAAQLHSMLPRMREQAIRELIDRQILLNAAADTSFTDAEFEAELAEMKEELPPGVTFEELLEKTGMDMSEVREQMRIRKMLLSKAEEASPATDEECRAFFKENKAGMAEEESVEASHILVSVPRNADNAARAAARAKIDNLKAQLDAGADFAELAKANSDCPSKANGGSLGRFGRGVMVPEFENAAFSQEIGKVGDVVETTFGYHLVLVTKRSGGEAAEYEGMKDRISELLTAQRQQEAVREFVEGLKASAKVQRFDEGLGDEAP